LSIFYRGKCLGSPYCIEVFYPDTVFANNQADWVLRCLCVHPSLREVEEVLTGEKATVKRVEAPLQTVAGETRICADHIAVLPDGGNGRSDGVVVIHCDITERVNREQELE
jgi:hypothetical protein